MPTAPGSTDRGGIRHRRRWSAARHPWLIGSLILLVFAGAATIAIITAPNPPQRAEGANESDPVTDTSAPGSPSVGMGPAPSPSPTPSPSASRTPAAPPEPDGQTVGGWPNARNTGVPAGVQLRTCATAIGRGGTYDRCQFNGAVTVKANNVRITRSLIRGAVVAGSGGEQRGLVISDTTIDCGCLADDAQTPPAISESNYTLLRVNVFNAGHGAIVNSNVTIQDSYIHGLGANTEAHKNGIYSGSGSNVVLRHNNIECKADGCTAAIGLLTDFSAISHWTIDHNLLNTNGSFCFYGSGGPSKSYRANSIVFTNNRFGRAYSAKCGTYGPVTYFDTNAPGMVWRGNVWADTGASVKPEY